MTATDEKIAGHLDRYFVLLQRQLDQTDDWPAGFTFPKPRGSAERKAFEAFMLQLRSAGIRIEPVTFTTRPGPRLNS
jgi:hypothetical protein